MKNTAIFLSLLATLAVTIPTTLPLIKAHAINSVLEAEKESTRCSELLNYASAKRDWVESEMAGTEGYMQTQALRVETKYLKRICNEAIKRFNSRYTLYENLHLI